MCKKAAQKLSAGLSHTETFPPLLNEVFAPRQCIYDVNRNNFLERGKVKSLRYGTDFVSYVAPKIWGILPN